MRRLFYLSVIVLCTASLSALGQNVILAEQNAASYLNYLNQMKAVEVSLLERKLSPNIELAKNYAMPDSMLTRLSDQFKKLIPKNYFSSDIMVIDQETKQQIEAKYIKWTYSTIVKNAVKPYADLLVYFEVGDGEAIKHPKVLKVEIILPKNSALDHASIIKEYKDRNTREASLLPLPGH